MGENGGRAAPSNREAARGGPGAAAPTLQKQDSLDDVEAKILQQVIEQSLREQEEIERAIQLSLSGGAGGDDTMQQPNAPELSVQLEQQITETGREGVQGLWFFECVHPTPAPAPQRRRVARGCVPARCALLLEFMGAARGLSLLHAVALAAGQGARDVEKVRRRG